MLVTRRAFVATLGLAAVATALPAPVATQATQPYYPVTPCPFPIAPVAPYTGISIRFIKHYDVAKDEAPNRFDCYFDPRHGFVSVLNGERA